MEAAAATATLAADGDVAPARPRPVSARSVYEALKKARLADESRKKKTKAAPAPKQPSFKTKEKKKVTSRKRPALKAPAKDASSDDEFRNDGTEDAAGDVSVPDDSSRDGAGPEWAEGVDLFVRHPHYRTLDAFDYVLPVDASGETSGEASGAVAFVPPATCFYLKGRLRLTVLSGTAEVLGYRMAADPHNSYDIYSPRGYSLLCIRAVAKGGKSDTDAVQRVLLEAGLTLEPHLLAAKSAENVVLLMRRLDSGHVDYTDRLFDVKSVLRYEPCEPPDWEPCQRLRFGQLCRALDASVVLRGAVFSARFYQEPDYWSDYVRDLAQRARAKEPVRLVLCGGKGVGKSTLLRFTVNRLLMDFPHVLVVDLDPGQPELVPAGCVAVGLVSRPLLGPNFSHWDQPPPLRTYFIGDVDVSSCPKRYVDACAQLLDLSRVEAPAHCPVIVNTMGFTNGVGLDLTLDVIRLARPTHLLQLVSLSARRNFSHDLDADYVASVRRGWSTAPLAAGGGAPAGGVETPWRPARYHFSTGVSASEHSERSTEEWGFRPSQLRQLGLLAYLSRLSTSPPSDGTVGALERDWTLTDWRPYRISWRRLRLCVAHQTVAPALALAAVNASLVALLWLDDAAEASVVRYRADATADQGQGADYPTVLHGLPLAPCLGYGVVRCVDYERRCLYVVTPEPLERLGRVNCLALGAVQLPAAVLLDPPAALRKHHGVQSGPKFRVPYVVHGPSAGRPSCQPFRKYNPVFSVRRSAAAAAAVAAPADAAFQ